MYLQVEVKPNGSISKHKARLVSRGFLQKSGLDYFEVFSPVARHEITKLVIAIDENGNWPLMHLDIKSVFLNGPLQKEVYLKYELELLKRFELTNCKFAITPAATNHKLDSGVESDDVDATTFKQLVGSLKYLYNTRRDICYTVGMDLKIKVSKFVKLMIDNKSTVSLAKNPILHERSKHIDTKFHFLHNQVQNEMFEVVHCSTQKQLADVFTKTIKIEHFIYLRNEIGIVDFN
ncbi:uncharacterized protein LOC131621385 [Vicia villosa]|uniref:uncharacterized protein LOC131621385 n=1 Tax=Vicia villosa TaxID=3911 RepID=UPI00273C959F|nr:uncharacterized protein LOC131621385 [Vicia villosa]